MIGYVLNNIVCALPDHVDAQAEQKLQLYSISNIEVVDAAGSVLTMTAENLYSLDISKCKDEAVVVLKNADDTQSFVVHNVEASTGYLERWLKLQQLGHLIPILKKLGWHKLKEAALKAKQLNDMQGTEQALKLTLDLLECDDNVELFRYWHRSSENIEDDAFDDLKATDLVDAGYKLTNKLKLVYHADKLNPWNDNIYPSVRKLLLSLADVVTALQGILPATLQISDYEILKLGIGVIAYGISSCRSFLIQSECDAVPAIVLPNVIQYSYEPYVYDIETKELLRIASYDEPNAYAQHMAVLEVSTSAPIYDFEMSIGGEDIDFAYIDNKAYFCLKPVPGKYDVEYRYSTEAGNRIIDKKTIVVTAACSRQLLYELAEPIEGDTEAIDVEAANIANLVVQWCKVSEYCDGRPYDLHMPKPYQQYYVPMNVKRLRICNADGIVYEGELSASTYLPDFTVAIERLTVLDITPIADNQIISMYVLMTTNYAAKYDYDVQYLLDDAWHTAEQLTKYLSSCIQPLWNAHTIAALLDSSDMNTGIVSVNNAYANNGHYMPLTLNKQFSDMLAMSGSCIINKGIDDALVSVATIADEATFAIENDKSLVCRAVRRQESFSLHSVLHAEPFVPYIIYRPNTWIVLYSGDMLLAEAYGLLVFAKTTSNKYRLHLFNDWYSKDIEL